MFPTPNDSAHQASEFGTFGSGARGAGAVAVAEENVRLHDGEARRCGHQVERVAR